MRGWQIWPGGLVRRMPAMLCWGEYQQPYWSHGLYGLRRRDLFGVLSVGVLGVPDWDV